MSVADRLLRQFEANISQSLGAGGSPGGDTVPETRTVQQPATPRPGPVEGRTRARDVGIMDIRNMVPDPGQTRKEFDEDTILRLASPRAWHQ
jgi:hypothetical protein